MPTCAIPPGSESASRRGQIGNVACVVIETEQRPGMQVSFWLDPARDYIPLRQHRIDDGEDRARLEISYRADPTCGWAPIGWTEARVGSGGPAYATIDGHNHRFHGQSADPRVRFSDRCAP